MVQQALVLIKPDAVVNRLTGVVLSRLGQANLELVGAKVTAVPKALAQEHYKHLSDKPFFPELIDYLQGKLHNCPKILALVYQGEEAIKTIRDIAGATDPEKADPSSLRGAHGQITPEGVMENVLHASSEPAEAEREIKLWFKPDELPADLYPTQEMVQQDSKVLTWAR